MKKSIVFKLFNIPILSFEVTSSDGICIHKNIDSSIKNNDTNIALLNNKNNNSLKNYYGQAREDLNKDNKVANDKDEIINCPGCGGKTYEKDLNICCVCGKPVCPDCSTEDPSSHSVFCNNCWMLQ